MLLLSSFFRLKELFQVKNGLTKSLRFFLKVPKIFVGRTTVNGEKKRMARIRRGNSTVQKDSAMRSRCAHLLSEGGEEKDRGDCAIRKKATTDA